METAEGFVREAVCWLKLALECASALVIGMGFLGTLRDFLRAFARWKPGDYTAIRLFMGRHLALALELQLGADILGTSIAPTWDQIGKLGAIAVIRTALNYFLSREIAGERREAGTAANSEPESSPVTP